MCDLCDGMAESELLADLKRKVERWGFTCVAVEGSPPWVYTIGLGGRFGHPELVVVGLHPREAHSVIDEAVRLLRGGDRLEIGAAEYFAEGEFEVGEVHPNRWRDGTFAMWHRYYEHFGEQPLPRALQLIPSEDQFCSHHAHTYERYRLDAPGGFSTPAKTRAERRRLARAEAKRSHGRSLDPWRSS